VNALRTYADREPVADDGLHTLASESADFDGFGGGVVRKARNNPAGTIHAVESSRDRTACGLHLHKLHVFAALTFESSEHTRRCGACSEALRQVGFHFG
jgi:hypothetical protein